MGATIAELQARTEAGHVHLGQGRAPGHFRVRFDHVDPHGKISLRRAGRMHHLGVGITHAREPVLMVIDPDTVTVINRHTGEVLSTHHIKPDHTYWRNQQQSPGRWPGLKL